tara:strand:- start:438 stop:2213 length:1776 start_codon:yes stop_codon:yes gene_type:complete
MSREAKIKIGATTKVKGPISGVIAQLKKLGKVSKKVNAGIKASIRGIGSVFRATQRVGVLAVAALGGIGFAVKKAFDFELAQKQFEVLLGSVEKAKARFQELKELSAGTPFELKNLIEASKTLEGFGLKGDKNVKALRMIGDAAAALDPQKLEEMALAFGRLFTGASVGLTGEPTMRLLELKVLAPKTKIEIDRLSKSAGNFDKVIALARKDMMRFTGGMSQLSTTGHGLFSTLKDNWTISLAAFGDEFMDLTKNTMREFIQKLTQLRKDGSIKEWAQKAVKSLTVVKSLLSDIFDPAKRQQAFVDIGNILRFAFKDAAAVAINLLKDAAPDIGQLIAKGFRLATKSVPTRNAFNKARKQLEEKGLIKKGAGIAFGKILNASKKDAALILAQIEKNRRERIMGEGFEPIHANNLKDFMAELSGRRKDGGINEPELRGVSLADILSGKVDPDKFSQAAAEMTEVFDRTTGELMGSLASFRTPSVAPPRTREMQHLQKFGNSALRGGKKTLVAGGGESRLGFGAGKMGGAFRGPGGLTRLEKPDPEIEKGIEERRGIGLGELFDMKQFGMTKKTGELGEANNPMHVVLDEAPV